MIGEAVVGMFGFFALVALVGFVVLKLIGSYRERTL
jgi:hypothetical protein